ncbi:flippase [Ichthyobacterium seriolicida]|uniref:Flippase n=1 Tax=Ichthyobacterium seriolicida TaxID=242600 RepID=A0A1J1DZI4_9FLAO|nr:flippase [Ichthyobacterium seriolicida]
MFNIFLARSLGPEKMGLLSYASGFTAFITSFTYLGLDRIVVKELVKQKNKRDVLLGTAFFLKLACAILVITVVYSIINSLEGDKYDENILVFVMSLITIFQSFGVIRFYFQSKISDKLVVCVDLLGLLTTLILQTLFILGNVSLIFFAWALVFENIILALGLVFIYGYSKLSILKWFFNFKQAIYLLKESWPLIISSIATIIYMRIDQVMIKIMLGNSEAGYYSVSVMFAEAWNFIPIFISYSVFPAIVKSKKLGEKIYYSRLQKFYDLMIWISLIIIIPMFFISSWIIEFMFGMQYSQASEALNIYIWSIVFLFLGVANSGYIVNEGLQIIDMIKIIISSIFNIILNYLLIPRIGIEGAAWSTLISYFTSNYLLLLLFKDTRKSFFLLSKSLLFNSTFIYVKKYIQSIR